MRTRTLNLGVLAHVDAGKTSLTERLLFDHGAISRLGSVDAGTTQTDGDALERERGITIRAAVASFTVDPLQVNLIDTPGHPDFVAEVQRALSVLDGVVLVLSAVEGVQAQTRVLMRTVRSMRLPTILFVNKIDRPGAHEADLVDEIRRRLTRDIVPLNSVQHIGTAAASVRTFESLGEPDTIDLLAGHESDVFGHFAAGTVPPEPMLRAQLAKLTSDGLVHPVLFGSALTGVGIAELTEAIATLLPGGLATPGGEADKNDPCGTVFAIERRPDGSKIGYLRLFDGEIRHRQSVVFHRRDSDGHLVEIRGKITHLDVVGATPGAGRAKAGDIARLRGIGEVRVGDQLGAPVQRIRGLAPVVPAFTPPTLEAVVRPRRAGDESSVHAALTLLADEDPLIRIRTLAGGGTSVLIFGEVQKEVVTDRLRRQFGLDVEFESTTPIYLEHVAGIGDALSEFDPRSDNLFCATVGLRVEPSPGEAVTFVSGAERGAMPRAFHAAIEDAVRQTLHEGLRGWEVIGCRVTLFRAAQLAPMSVAADFRNLTPIVLLRALRAAGTRVVEPCMAVEISSPLDRLGGVIGCLSSIEAEITLTEQRGDEWIIHAVVPSRRSQDLTIALAGLTRGEGAIWSEPAPPRIVRGAAPTRPRTDGNPLALDEYLHFLALPGRS